MHGDTHLKASVLAELAWDPSVTAAHIGVTADEGVVSLTGHVGSLGEKHAAQRAAARVKGVKAVVGDIGVRMSGDQRQDDDAIAGAAVRGLAWQAGDPGCRIEIGVEAGRITLKGQVARQSQREDAESDLRRLRGVVGLDNQLTIKPRVDLRDVSEAITHALHRSWFFDPDTVAVSAAGGTVTLSGTVHTLHDKFVAGTTAWAAPGVTEVENGIRVV